MEIIGSSEVKCEEKEQNSAKELPRIPQTSNYWGFYN